MSSRGGKNGTEEEYTPYDADNDSNALIITGKKKKEKKAAPGPAGPVVSKEVLIKLAKLEEKKIRKAERLKSLQVINSNQFDDKSRILLTKSSTLGSKLTLKERMAYAYQASQFNLDVDDKDMERMQTALAEQGDFEAANKVLEKKAQHIARGMTANPFIQLNSSAASLQAILNDSTVSGDGATKTVRKYTTAELSKFATDMGKHVNLHDDFRKQEKKKQRRVEDRIMSEFHAQGKTNVVILPDSLAGLTGSAFGSDVVAVTSSNRPVNTAAPVSAIAAISKTTSLSTLAAANAITQGLVNKKRKNALNALFDTAGDFSESDDEEEAAATAPAASTANTGKAKDKDVVMSAADAKRLEEDKKAAEIAKAIELAKQEAKASKVVGTGPTVIRTDKAAVLSRNIPVAVPVTAVVGAGPVTNADLQSQNNPYAVNFKVISAKPAARRAAAAAKRALMDESEKRLFDKRTGHMNKERILMAEAGDIDDDDEEEEESDDDLSNVMGEEDKKVKFESWDLVKKVGGMTMEKPKKVLFDASKGGLIKTTAVTTTSTAKPTAVATVAVTEKEKEASTPAVRTSSQPTVVIAKKGKVDAEVPKKPVAIAVVAGAQGGVKRKTVDVVESEEESENDAVEDEDGEEDEEEDEEEDAEEDMEEDEDEEENDEEEQKEKDPLANIGPPRKGLRFDGSKMSFEELLERVTADLAADSDEEPSDAAQKKGKGKKNTSMTDEDVEEDAEEDGEMTDEDEEAMIVYHDEDEDDEDGEGMDEDDDMEYDEDEDDDEEPKEEDPLANLAPPRKGLRFDGSKMSFEELLKRVTEDLAADSEEEKESEAAEVKGKEKKAKKDSKASEKAAEVKKVAETKATPSAPTTAPTRTPVVRNQKYAVPVTRKPEIENARLQLPVCGQEQEIMEAITYNDILILSGETGSGKTTQVPQFLYEAGYGRDGMIAVTQPRRVAAMSSARRVGEELNAEDTMLVGYQIRYDSHVKSETQIKMMTEGILLKEIQNDFLLRKYSVIIVDEAHERGLNTDVLLGLLSRIVKLRNDIVARGISQKTPETIATTTAADGTVSSDLSALSEGKGVSAHGIKTGGITGGKLKLVIMSATLRVSDFTANPRLFPIPLPVLNVPSRQYPVAMHFSRVTAEDYVAKALQKVMRIHTRLPPGAILVFLTGRQEIELFCKKLKEVFPEPQAGVDNSVESFVKIGASNLKSKAIRSLRDAQGRIDLKDPKVISMIAAEMERIKTEAKKKKRSKVVYKKGQPFSLEDVARDEEGVIDGDLIDLDNEEKLKQAAEEIVLQQVIQDEEAAAKKDGEEGESEEKKSEEEEMLFELSDDDDYDDADDEDDSDDDEEDDDGSDGDSEDEKQTKEDGEEEEKGPKDGKGRKLKKKKNESTFDAEKRAGSSVNDKWESELEALKAQEYKPPMLVLPLYALLSTEQQMKVFKHHEYTHGARLVVVSTNVAETSVTIPGIKYVVDTGREKRKVYDNTTGSSKFEVGFIAQSSANQRAGRAGRTGPGHCYRLYSGAVFDDHFPLHAEPEILRQPIESTVLQMKAMGIKDVANFPFPTPPPMRALQYACHTLYILGALEQLLDQILAKNKKKYYATQHAEVLLQRAKMQKNGLVAPASTFQIAAPKAAWQLIAEQKEAKEQQEEALRRLEASKAAMADEEREEEERKARMMENMDTHFCIHGREFVDTTSLNITAIGRAMSLFPLHPRFSKLLLTAANQEGCLPLAIAVTAALTVNELVVKPNVVRMFELHAKKEQEKAERLKKQGVEARAGDDEEEEDEDDESDEEKEEDEDTNSFSREPHPDEDQQKRELRQKLAEARAKAKAAKKAKAKAAKQENRARMKVLHDKWHAARARWCVPHSDILSTLRLVGAFVHMRHTYAMKQWKLMDQESINRGRGPLRLVKPRCFETLPPYAQTLVMRKLQKFCDDNFVRMKAMNELLQLREQLTRIVAQRLSAGAQEGKGTFHQRENASGSMVGAGDVDESEDAGSSSSVAGASAIVAATTAGDDLAYDYATPTSSSSSAPTDNTLHSRLLKLVRAPLLSLPTDDQELALTQIMTTGFLDKVARRMDEDTKMKIIKNTASYSLVPQKRFYPKEIKGKLALAKTAKQRAEILENVTLSLRDLDDAYELLETGEPVFLSPDSVVADSAPEFVIFTDMQKHVGRRLKTVISGLTVVQPEWMATLAAPLCAFSKPLEEPLPVFDARTDQVMCFVNVTMGPHQWPLPLAKQKYDDEEVEEIVQMQVAAPTSTNNGKRAKEMHTVSKVVKRVTKPVIYHRHFARLILEGAVFPKLRAMRPYYTGRASAPLSTPMPPQAQALVSALHEKNITCRKDMLRIWYGDSSKGIRAQPDWLWDEMSAWVHSAKRHELKKIWPPADKSEL